MNNAVAITDFHGDSCGIEQQLIEQAGWQFELLPTRAQLLHHANHIVALGIRHTRVDAELMENLTQCRIIVRYGVGYDNVDIANATDRGILVAYVPDYCVDEVAEQALLGALLHIRQIDGFRRDVAAGSWNGQAHSARRANSLQFSIVGLGRIGSTLSRKASGVGFNVAAYDPFLPQQRFEDLQVRRHSTLTEALESADILSLHVPLTQAPNPYPTRHLIGLEELSTMKKDSMLINTSRGPVVDNLALCQTLAAGSPGAALLDVLENEPPQHSQFTETDYPTLARLQDMKNVVLTPHCSFNSIQSVARVKQLGTNEICRVLEGRWPRSEAWLNPEAKGIFEQRFGTLER